MEGARGKPVGVNDQRNKGHKKLSAKLMKRREGERKRKQDKKSKDKKRDKKENRTARLDKYVGKLHRFCQGDTAELLELFGQLDEGVMVNISDLESELLQKLLKKVFKLLEMGKNPEKEYFKPEGYECVRLKMERLFKRAVSKAEGKEKKQHRTRGESSDRESARGESDGESDSEGDAGDEDGDSAEDEGDLHDEAASESKHSKMQEEALERKQANKSSKTEHATHSSKPQVPTSVYGPARPARSDVELPRTGVSVNFFLYKPSQLLTSGIEPQAEEDLFSAVLNRTSDYKSDHRDKLRQGLLKNPKDLIELPEEELAKAEKARRAVEAYDKIHRPKTLLEIHQEAKKQSSRKGEILHDGPELFSIGGVSRVDSKKVFSMLSSAGSGLSTRFSDGLDANQSVNKLKQNFM